MTADHYMALSAIGACLSAIAALTTVVIIYRQLRAAYRPELALSQVVIRSTINGKIIVPELWTDTDDAEYFGASDTIGRLVIPILNIGLGTANEVDVKWSFPIEKTIQDLNAYSESAKVVTYDHREERLNLKCKDGTTMSIGWRARREQRIDYIIPSSIKSTPILLTLPYAYGVVVSAMTFFYSKTDHPRNHLRVPVLRLDIKYRDIARGRCSVSFAIDCDVAVFNQDGEISRGYLRCKRIG